MTSGSLRQGDWYNLSQHCMSPEKEAALEDSWRRTLARIPTVLGRLAYMASLRNTNTGQYEHFGLAQRIGSADVDRLIRRNHHELFQQWLCFGLQRQKEELEEYLEGLEGDRREIISHWLSIEPYNGWIPAETRDVERQLFLSDLQVLLQLIRTGYGVASRDPES
ncbi:MAG: hypothetical protein ABJC09_15015 [Terriglobia bacterium]